MSRRPPDAPEWLLTPEIGLCPCCCVGRRRRGSFVDKTVAGAANILREAMCNDEVAGRSGLLQRLDARAKLVSLLALLLAASLAHQVVILAALYAGTLILARASRLGLAFFVRRVWLFVPVFTGVIVIPAMFSFVTPGRIVVPIGDGWGLTEQGLAGAALIVARVATSVSLVVLLTLTTRWIDLLSSLRALRVPPVFVLVIGMAHRYVFALTTAVDEMFTARKARSIGPRGGARADRAFVAASAGALFGKAHALSEDVHQAMVARAYRGTPRTLSRTRLNSADLAWVGVCAATAILAVMGDRALGA